MSSHLENNGDTKNGTVTGQTNGTDKPSRITKTHSDYWKSRILRRTFQDRHGKTGMSPEYSVRLRHLGEDTYFNLATPNQAAAAVKARDIYVFLIANGWAATGQATASLTSVGIVAVTAETSFRIHPGATPVPTGGKNRSGLRHAGEPRPLRSAVQ